MSAGTLERLRALVAHGDASAAERLFELARRHGHDDDRRRAARLLLASGRWRLEHGAASAMGPQRRVNEDAALAFPSRSLFGVLDGAGGHVSGIDACAVLEASLGHLLGVPAWAALERCCVLAHQTLRRRLEALLPAPPRVLDAEAFAALVRAASRALHALFEAEQPRRRGFASATLGLVRDGQLELVHAGKTRAYLVRDGQGAQLTHDHTLLAQVQVQHMPQLTGLDAAELAGIATRSLGVEPEVELERTHVALQPGDMILLCSMGLYERITLDTALPYCSAPRHGAPRRIASALVDAACAAGCRDNATAVVLALRA